MKHPQSFISKIPMTPKEKRRKAVKLSLLVIAAITLIGMLAFSGTFSKLFPAQAVQPRQAASCEAALIAEAGVKEFTSLSLERGYEDWQLNLCSLSSERFCTLVKSGFGKKIWDKVQASNAGVVNLSTRAIGMVYENPATDDTHQFWRVRYELVSADGERAYTAVVSVVQEEGRWKFNGFSFLPEATPDSIRRGFQEEQGL
jgi:hypothetical protein